MIKTVNLPPDLVYNVEEANIIKKEEEEYTWKQNEAND